MDAYLKPELLKILIAYSIPEQGGADRRILIGKRRWYMNGKPFDERYPRRFRLLYKYGLMKQEDRKTDFLYSISPKGAALADSIKLSIKPV